MKRLITIAATGLIALPSLAGAAPPAGLIHEIPIHSNVVDIAPGPDGNLWFTENLRERRIGRITPAGKVTKFKKLPKGVEPADLVTGPDGNVWFTYDPGGFGFSGGGVGRITPAGKVTLFPEPPDLHGVPFEIVAGPDGNLWFTHAAILTPTGQAIGRITPQGEISEFSAGLSGGSEVAHLIAGPDGNVWFSDESNHPAIGRITPSGVITELGGLPPRGFPIVEGPAPGPEGNLYFSGNEPRPLVERITPAGTTERFGAGLDRRTEDVGPFVTGSDGNVWFGVEKSLSRHQHNTEAGLTAIGRITPGGKIREFNDCLRPMPEYAGPNFLTLGPEGDVWFTTWPSGEDSDPTRASIPSIGRITPAGRITEFRYGLTERSQPEELVSAAGRLWFIDRETDSIGEIRPPRRPANTFQLLRLRQPSLRRVAVEIAVPGPGTLRLRETRLPGHRRVRSKAALLGASSIQAPACGPAAVPVPVNSGLRRLVPKRGELYIDVVITFTPRGGTPFSEPATVFLDRRDALPPVHPRLGRLHAQVHQQGTEVGQGEASPP